MPRGRPRREGVERDALGRIRSSNYETAESRSAARSERRQAKLADATRMGKDAALVERWNTLRSVLLQLCDDPRLASPLGRMLMLGQPLQISRAEFDAGEKMLAILDDYDRHVLGRRRHAAAASISVRGIALAPEVSDEKAMAIKVARAEVEAALSTRPGSFAAVKALLWDIEWEDDSAPLAVAGLQALAALWRLDVDRPRAIRSEGERVAFRIEGRVREFLISYGGDGGDSN